MILGIVGPFGDTNFGDYAMLVNNIYSIQPDKTIVFTYNENLLNMLAETYLKNYKVYSVIVKNDYMYETIFSNSYNIQYDDEVLVPTQILSYISNEKEVREAIRRIDVLFVSGGGYFNRVWSARHRKSKILSILGTMLIASEEHKRIVFGGNTFGPFDESREFYRCCFLGLQNVNYAARDDVYSVANLRQIGIENKITLLPDDLYFLHEKFSIYKPHIQMVLPEKYMVLELYCSLDEIEKNYTEIDTFVNKMFQIYGVKVVFVSLDKEFGGEKQGESLKHLQNLIVWDFKDEPYRRIEDVQYIVRHAQFVLCQRYHLFLFAIANNIPAYQMLKSVCGDKRYYYAKTNGLLKQVFGNQVYKQSNFFTDDIIKGFNEILFNYKKFVQEQQSRFNLKKEVAEQQMKESRLEYLRKYLFLF